MRPGFANERGDRVGEYFKASDDHGRTVTEMAGRCGTRVMRKRLRKSPTGLNCPPAPPELTSTSVPLPLAKLVGNWYTPEFPFGSTPAKA
jgi:hypothetical protein